MLAQGINFMIACISGIVNTVAVIAGAVVHGDHDVLRELFTELHGGINQGLLFGGKNAFILNGLNDIDEMTELLWKNLNSDNKISLFVRYTDMETGKFEQRILNKHQ